MKKLLLLLIILLSITAKGQSYLGTITKKVNFRSEPNSDSDIISSLKPTTKIFIVSLEYENDYYNVIDIETDTEGFVHKSYVKVGNVINKSEGSVFVPTGESSNYDTEVKIFNNTSRTLTLKLNADIFHFDPHETKNLTLTPGGYDFRASAPGVIPYIGNENLKSNQGYSWQFYIATQRR
jgi:uncharacterized protein YgiM (DUF1202 family)